MHLGEFYARLTYMYAPHCCCSVEDISFKFVQWKGWMCRRKLMAEGIIEGYYSCVYFFKVLYC